MKTAEQWCNGLHVRLRDFADPDCDLTALFRAIQDDACAGKDALIATLKEVVHLSRGTLELTKSKMDEKDADIKRLREQLNLAQSHDAETSELATERIRLMAHYISRLEQRLREAEARLVEVDG